MAESLSDLYPERLVRIFRQQVLNNREFPVRPPPPPMVTPLVGTHEGVSCDGCSMTAFVGNRYKCLRCSDYDLCYGCYIVNRFGDQTQNSDTHVHDETHPMQLILSSADFEAVYDGDNSRRYDERRIFSFTCPYCNITGLTDRQFGSHVTTLHQEPPNFTVICPLCIGIADMEHSISRETENLCAHWVEHHSLTIDQLRTDPPTTRPTQRRPMLARRNQRTVARPTGTRILSEEIAVTELTDLMRNLRPEDELRRLTEMMTNNLPMTQANFVRTTQRFLEGRTERQPVIVEPVAQMSAEQLLHRVIRPLETVPIYPLTSDESGDETPQPAADSVSSSEVNSLVDEEEEEDDETPVAEDEDLANDEFWKTLKSRLTNDEVQLILRTMKGKGKEEKEGSGPMWKTRPLKTMANTMKVTITSGDADGEQGWLPLLLETIPIRSTLCGGYWSDKRFLRPRKMQREQSVASSNAEIMEKADVVMAICRATSIHEPELSDPSKPDVALREALQHLNLGQRPAEMTEYHAAEEVIQMPDRDPITTGEEDFEMPDFTSRGYSQIVDGNVPLGVVPEADEAIHTSEDDEVEDDTSGEDEEDDDDDDDEGESSQDSSIPDEINIP